MLITRAQLNCVLMVTVDFTMFVLTTLELNINHPIYLRKATEINETLLLLTINNNLQMHDKYINPLL